MIGRLRWLNKNRFLHPKLGGILKLDTFLPVELADGLFWVGVNEKDNSLQCNIYLIIDNDEGILFDPGSVINFEEVYKRVANLIPIEKIKYIFLSHQDPDLASSVPLFERHGFKGKIVTHWRTTVIIRYYGIKSDYYIVNENNYSLKLSSRRIIKFYHTPYLHFPGAIIAYDLHTRVLITGDLFGAFSHKWQLFAGNDYIEQMNAFHEHYMPGNDIIRPIMEMLEGIDITMIAPQHGSVIKDDIKKYIIALRELECGIFLQPVKKNLAESGGYTGVCNLILIRYNSIFKKEIVASVFEQSDILIDSDIALISDHNYTGRVLWDRFFEQIYANRGVRWLTVIEPLVEKIVKEYQIDLPSVFKSKMLEIEQEKEELYQENAFLKEVNRRLKQSLEKATDDLLKCPLTKLYNEYFFAQYLKKEVDSALHDKRDFSLLIISPDNFAALNYKYSRFVGDETLKKVSLLLENLRSGAEQIFRSAGANFVYYIPASDEDQAAKNAEKIRKTVELSGMFVEPITVSIGLVSSREFYDSFIEDSGIFADRLYNETKKRVYIAKKMGGNTICAELTDLKSDARKVLLVDNEPASLELINRSLEQIGLNVLICHDGEAAMMTIEKEKPDLVIADIMIQKIDGLSLRQNMRWSSEYASIPFILISYKKDDETVKRASELNIDYYFKRPFLLSELIAAVKNRLNLLSLN